MKPSKQFIKADAIKWLEDNKGLGSIITSPPDAEEVNLEINEWINWFSNAIEVTLKATKKNTPTIFIVTDRKHDKQIISKANMIFIVANKLKRVLQFHKIALRLPINTPSIFRPAYTHLLAFNNINDAKDFKIQGSDVYHRGQTIYKDGTGLEAAIRMVKYAGNFSDTIINPFSGSGTICHIAEKYGYNSIGIELLESQIKLAKKVKIS